MLFLFVRACHSTTSSKSPQKIVKKAVLHNLRYDYCSVDGVAYVNMYSCRIHKDVFFAKAAIAVAVGCRYKCALVFLCFGTWVTMPP